MLLNIMECVETVYPLKLLTKGFMMENACDILISKSCLVVFSFFQIIHTYKKKDKGFTSKC